MDQEKAGSKLHHNSGRGWFAVIVQSIIDSFVKLTIVLILGTAGGAVVCLYYGFPLIFSVFGGIAIFAIATAAFLAN